MKKALVTGAGGFIGYHLVNYLKDQGYWVRGADIKYPEYEKSKANEFLIFDLRILDSCLIATKNIEEVYALAADMGGMGFISSHNAEILYNNTLINYHTIESARSNNVKKYLFSSSACIYPEYKQLEEKANGLKEDDAYPAQPQDAYGWEKLVTERLCQHYKEDYNFETRIVRFHNMFGPFGSWKGGREKAPAALCRKIAIAKLTRNHEIEIWGDGKQTRSFCYIDDGIEGIFRVMNSTYNKPINVGQNRLISINELVDIISNIAGIKIKKKYIEGPQGVRGRNSDNTLLEKITKWKPKVTLEEGLRKTYNWIEEQVKTELKSVISTR